MSYILDALRKSEQQRRRGAASALLAPQAEPAARTNGPWLSQALFGAALIAGGIVIGALRPWKTAEPPAAAQSGTVQPLSTLPSAPSAPAPAQQREPLRSEQVLPAWNSAAVGPPAVAREGTAEEPKVSEGEKRKASVATQVATKSPTREARPAAVSRPANKTAKSERAERATRDDAQNQNVTAIEELPLSIRQEIPQVAIAVHAYSDLSERRLIGIEDRVLREGETVAPGLVLERITPDGVILRYKDYRFRRGVR